MLTTHLIPLSTHSRLGPTQPHNLFLKRAVVALQRACHMSLVGIVLVGPFLNGHAWAQQTPGVMVEGLTQERLLNNVRNALAPLRLECDAPSARWLSYMRDAERRAQSALRALGHFKSEVVTQLDVEGACPQVRLRVEAGPAVVLDQVDIRILGPFASEAVPHQAREGVDLRVGDTLDQGLYDRTRDELINRARSMGYLDAQFLERTLWVDPEEDIARVTLILDSGPRYRFGAMHVEQSILAPVFVQRLLPVQAGDPYSSDALAQISSHLMASGYFAHAHVHPRLDDIDDLSVPIDVALTERARTAYAFRLGFGTDTGLSLRGDVDRRYVNRMGHRWRAGLGFSQRVQTVDTVYSIPLHNPLTDSFDVYARLQNEDINGITTTHQTAGMQWSWQEGAWSRALFTEFLGEQSRFGQTLQGSRQFWLGGGRLGHRRLDNPLFPTRGHSWDLEIKGASASLLSSASLAQARINSSWAHPVGRSIMKARGELATTWSSDFGQLPKSLRWFAGGDQSVRGYGFESLGPRNPEGQVVGGQHRVLLSVEGMYPVVGDEWYAAAFVDTGNAFNQFDAMDLHTGAGLGVRWRSPIGLLRIDIAQPLKGATRQPRLHLAVGAEF